MEIGETAPSGRVGLDHRVVIENAERPVDAVDRTPVTRIEHFAHRRLVDPETFRQTGSGQTAVPQREGERRLGRGLGGHRHQMLAGAARAGLGDRIAVVNAAGDRLFERVGRPG